MTSDIKFYVCKNWIDFQHYKRRNPPWIKLHRALLDDYEFSKLSEKNKLHLILLWLYGSQNHGRIPNNTKFLERKIDCTDLDLETLACHGFLIAEIIDYGTEEIEE